MPDDSEKMAMRESLTEFHAKNQKLSAEVAVMRSALEIIIAFGSGGSAQGCESFTSGDCASAGRTYGAKYGADRWCDVCVARNALRVVAS